MLLLALPIWQYVTFLNTTAVPAEAGPDLADGLVGQRLRFCTTCCLGCTTSSLMTA